MIEIKRDCGVGVARTVQLVPLEVLGPRINLVARWIVAGEAARSSLAAGALVCAGPSRESGPVLRRRRFLSLHGARRAAGGLRDAGGAVRLCRITSCAEVHVTE